MDPIEQAAVNHVAAAIRAAGLIRTLEVAKQLCEDEFLYDVAEHLDRALAEARKLGHVVARRRES